MEDCCNKLDFLRHTLREFLDLFVPPRHNVEFFKPNAQTRVGISLGETFELRKIESLFANLHFAVKPAFLGKITYASGVVESEGVPIKGDRARVGGSDGIYYSDQRSLACAIRAKKPENGVATDGQRDIVECQMRGETFGDVFDFEHNNRLIINGFL